MPKPSTREQKDRFLAAVERGESVQDAAALARVDRTTPYLWEQKDPLFRRLWQEARLSRLARLKDTAFDLAMAGDVTLIRFLLSRYEPAPLPPAPTRAEIVIHTDIHTADIHTEGDPEGGRPPVFLSQS